MYKAFFDLVGSKQPETFEQLQGILPSLKDETGTSSGRGEADRLSTKVDFICMCIKSGCS